MILCVCSLSFSYEIHVAVFVTYLSESRTIHGAMNRIALLIELHCTTRRLCARRPQPLPSSEGAIKSGLGIRAYRD
jgi:hypothetical protein